MKVNQTAMHPRVLPLLLGLVIPPAPLAWPGGQRNRHKMHAAGASVAGFVALSAIQRRLGDGPGCVVMCHAMAHQQCPLLAQCAARQALLMACLQTKQTQHLPLLSAYCTICAGLCSRSWHRAASGAKPLSLLTHRPQPTNICRPGRRPPSAQCLTGSCTSAQLGTDTPDTLTAAAAVRQQQRSICWWRCCCRAAAAAAGGGAASGLL